MSRVFGRMVFIVILYIVALLVIPNVMSPIHSAILAGIERSVTSYTLASDSKAHLPWGTGSQTASSIVNKYQDRTIGQPISGYEDLEPLFRAIRDVETAGFTDISCQQANGDITSTWGPSIGCFQITQAFWKESGVPGSWEQVRDPTYAKRTMIGYWQRYETYSNNALSRRDFQTLAKVHNGGPSGWATDPNAQYYWTKVQKALN